MKFIDPLTTLYRPNSPGEIQLSSSAFSKHLLDDDDSSGFSEGVVYFPAEYILCQECGMFFADQQDLLRHSRSTLHKVHNDIVDVDSKDLKVLENPFSKDEAAFAVANSNILPLSFANLRARWLVLEDVDCPLWKSRSQVENVMSLAESQLLRDSDKSGSESAYPIMTSTNGEAVDIPDEYSLLSGSVSSSNNEDQVQSSGSTENEQANQYESQNKDNATALNLCWQAERQVGDMLQKRLPKTVMKKAKSSLEGEPRFQCECCPKSFAQLKVLVEHRRVHTGEKPFKCPICGAAFKQLTHRNGHFRTHYPDYRPFACETCGKQFARKFSLKVHSQIHEGVFKYQCGYCDKKFRQNAEIKKHQLGHHNGRPTRFHII